MFLLHSLIVPSTLHPIRSVSRCVPRHSTPRLEPLPLGVIPEFIESFKGRKDILAYCTKHGTPVDAKPEANFSIDQNMYHTSYESGAVLMSPC